MTGPVQPLVWMRRGCTCLPASSESVIPFHQPKQLYGNMLRELPTKQASSVRARKAAPEGANSFVLNFSVQHSATARVNSRTVKKTTVYQLVQYMCSNGQLSNFLYRFACGCWQQFDASHMLFKLLFKRL